MKIHELREWLAEVDNLVLEHKNLTTTCRMQKQQLALIAAHYGGRIDNIHYEDLDDLDWDNITVLIGMDSLRVTTKDGKPIKSYADFPRKRANTPSTQTEQPAK